TSCISITRPLVCLCSFYPCYSLSLCILLLSFVVSFFFTATPTTEIYTLSLHDALPISGRRRVYSRNRPRWRPHAGHWHPGEDDRSEEHTSELQSPDHLVCRLLLEKKKNEQR